MINQSLIGAEEEQAVLLDPPAGVGAKLVLVDCGHSRREKISRVEGVVAKKLPCSTVKLIGAGFRSHHHLRSGIMPVLR